MREGVGNLCDDEGRDDERPATSEARVDGEQFRTRDARGVPADVFVDPLGGVSLAAVSDSEEREALTSPPGTPRRRASSRRRPSTASGSMTMARAHGPNCREPATKR